MSPCGHPKRTNRVLNGFHPHEREDNVYLINCPTSVSTTKPSDRSTYPQNHGITGAPEEVWQTPWCSVSLINEIFHVIDLGLPLAKWCHKTWPGLLCGGFGGGDDDGLLLEPSGFIGSTTALWVVATGSGDRELPLSAGVVQATENCLKICIITIYGLLNSPTPPPTLLMSPPFWPP